MSLSNFDGTVASDFMKRVFIPDDRKDTLINYSANEFLPLRNAIVEYIKAVYPLDYENFAESDLAMMLVEVIAYMGAVLSLKADLLANESFIGTARSRKNVQKLLELIGVSLRGPLAAAANARYTIKTALTSGQNNISISPAKRVVSVKSPQDGGLVSYTLYKVSSGRVQLANTDSSITLDKAESNLELGQTWDNLALLEGSLVVDRGTFTNFDSVQSVTLTQSPIIEGSVDVYINAPDVPNASGAYTQEESIYYASGPTAKIFQVNLDDSYGGTVVFGDNVAGISPPVNSTYEITYRVGGGTRGNVPNSYINAQTDCFIDGSVGNTEQGALENTSLATGGSDAETIAHAKKWAPLFFKAQDRLVTLEDYVAKASKFLSSYGTTGKVTAAVRRAYSSANVIDVYVLERASNLQLQQATTGFKMELLENLNTRKMLTDEIVVVDGVVRTLDLVMTISVDHELLPREEEIKAGTRDAVLTYFNDTRFDFGDPFIISDFTRVVFTEVPKVRYATVDNISQDIPVEFNEIIQLNNLVINVKGV